MSDDKPRSKTLERILIGCIAFVVIWCAFGYFARIQVLGDYAASYEDAKLVSSAPGVTDMVLTDAGKGYYQDFQSNYESLQTASVLTASWYAYKTTSSHRTLQKSLAIS